MLGLGLGINRGSVLGSGGSAFSGLLDTYTGAAAAYSTRRLYSLYTGAALRVREDSGDTETDIGFDANGDLDTAAIATHCGSANGYVTKWYGQESSGGTGSGNDAEQSTGTAQPQIYNGTAVNTLNGKPILSVSGIKIGLVATVPETANKDLSVFSVSKFDGTYNIGGRIGNSTLFLAQNGNTGSIFSGFVTTPSAFINGTSFTGNADNLYDNYFDTQSLFTAIDGEKAGTDITLTTSLASNFYQSFDVQEWIMFEDIDPTNRAGIETNINNYFSIY